MSERSDLQGCDVSDNIRKQLKRVAEIQREKYGRIWCAQGFHEASSEGAVRFRKGNGMVWACATHRKFVEK